MNIINPLIAFVLGLISGLIVFMLIRLRIERKSKSLANKKGLIEKAERKTYEGDLEKLDLIKLNPPKDSQDAYYDSKEIFITFRERDMFPFGRNSHTPASNPSSLDFSVGQMEKYRRKDGSLKDADDSKLDFTTMYQYPFEFKKILDSGEMTAYSKIRGAYVNEIRRQVYNDLLKEEILYYLPDGTCFFKVRTKSKTPAFSTNAKKT